MRPAHRGFTLLELLIVVAIVAILAAIAYPSYKAFIVRTSRESAQSQLIELANLQEKIFLNSSSYAGSVTKGYTGKSDGTPAGGLGVASGLTADGKYTLSVAPTAPGQTFTLTATPVSGTTQVGDGDLTINQANVRTWGSSGTW